MTEPQHPYVSIPPAKIDEHHYRCPICHQVFDIRDLDEAAKHLEPGRCAPHETRPMYTRQFLKEVVEPNVAELSDNPTSVQRAWNALVSILHVSDYLAIEKGTKPDTEAKALEAGLPSFALVRDIGNAFKHAERGNGDRRGLAAQHVKIGDSAAFDDGSYFSDGASFSDAEPVLRVEFNGEIVDLVHLCEECVSYLRTVI